MLDTTYLKPRNKPRAYFSRAEDGSMYEVKGHSRRYDVKSYAYELQQYIRWVNGVRRCFWRSEEELDERKIQVVQKRLKEELDRMEKASGPMPEHDEFHSLPYELKAFYEAQRVIELNKRRLALQEEIQRTTMAYSLQLLSLVAGMTRRALDQAVADVQSKRWAYRHLLRDYEERRSTWERMLAEKYTRHERAIETLVDEMMENMLETH